MQKTAPSAATVIAPATPPPSAPQQTGDASQPNNPVVITVPPANATFTMTAPRTKRDLEALEARREELSTQLQSVDGRRSKLMSQLRSTDDPVAVKGLQAQLALLDARQLQLESDLQQTGQLLSGVAGGLMSSTSDAPRFAGFSNNQTMALSVLSIIFVFFPLALGISKSIWRRSSRAGIPPQVLTETAQRLERLESAVDAIAVEVERISEGQRFVTRLLSEGSAAPALGPGQETVRAAR